MLTRLGSRIDRAVMNGTPQRSATYQKNVDSWPARLNHSAMYSADPPNEHEQTLSPADAIGQRANERLKQHEEHDGDRHHDAHHVDVHSRGIHEELLHVRRERVQRDRSTRGQRHHYAKDLTRINHDDDDDADWPRRH